MRRVLTTIFMVWTIAALAACGGSSTPAVDNGPGTDPGDDILDVLPTDAPDAVGDEGRDTTNVDPGTDEGQDVTGDPGQTPDEGVVPGDVPDVEVVPGCKEGDPCDDGNPCTWGEACNAAGACVGGTVYTCDDGRDCTTDTCDGKGNCQFVIKADACLVDGICRAKDELDPYNPCASCVPGSDKGAFTTQPDTTVCDPTAIMPVCQLALSGKCASGVCVPDVTFVNACDDGNTCTADSCDPVTGACVHAASSGGEPCVLDDRCKAGTCMEGKCIIPANASCDDGNACTEDSCNPASGCEHKPLSDIPCDDGSACTVDDTCTGGACIGLPTNCDDGNICTLDGCNNITGCWHDVTDNTCCEGGVSKCDDGNPCTNDDCDPVTLACINTPNTAACNDGNPCTVNDSCEAGYCSGVSKNCNDGNPCTLDSCQAGKCIHTAVDTGTCDDGRDCSTGDHCEAGACVADTSACDVCTYTFAPAVSKFVAMSMADNGQAGNGLNLDELATTCAPSDNCCCGVDNALGPLAGLPVAQTGISDAMTKGQIILLFEHRNLRTDGGAYTLAFYAGKLDPANATCDFQTQDCQYIVDKNIFKQWPDCGPLVTLDNAKIVGNKLTAGGKAYRFPFDLPLAGINLHVDLYMTRLEANVVVAGGKVLSMQGLLGGAVPKQQMIDAVNAIDPWTITQIDKATVLSFIDILVVPDIDGDGDGVLESASIGIKFSANAGTITNVY